MSDRIFKSPEAREQLEDWYDRFLAKVDAPVEHLEVETSHGPNHVLAVGDSTNPPLVCVHGARSSSAHTAAELGPLAERFYVLLPDAPGHSVRGPEVNLPDDGEIWAGWLVEVLDGLELDRVALLGVSWGGFISLQATALAPERVAQLVLVVPAGVVKGKNFKGLVQIIGPMMMYNLFPSEARLRRFMEPMMTTWDDDWAHYLPEAMKAFAQRLTAPPLIDAERLASIEVPVLAFAGTDDLTVPGERLFARLEDLVPHAERELIEGCKHMPPTTDEFRAWLGERVTAFLANDASAASAMHAPNAQSRGPHGA